MKQIDRRISFNGGEISPWTDPRVDLDKYRSSCRRLENFRPAIYGGAFSRPGMVYVAEQLSTELMTALMASGDPLAVHAREELKLDPNDLVRPVQAALVSAVSFAGGAALPLAIIVLCPAALRVPFTLTAALSALALLGGLSAKLGRVPIARVLVRVIAGGLLAMGLTYGLGTLFGAGG